MAKKAAPKKRIIKGRDFADDKRQDGLRKAKSGGWRKSYTNEKPTKKEIKEHYEGASNGVYMENRINKIDRNTRAKKGERFEKGGSIDSSMRFTGNDYDKLIDSGKFEGVKNGNLYELKEIDSSKVIGKFNESKETLFIAGKKDLSNPLVVWLKDNSYMSSDNVDKLAKGGEVNYNYEKGKNYPVKTVSEDDYEKLGLETFPNFSKTGSVSGMKKKYYGKDALLVKCGSYIYNVTSNPEIYFNDAYEHGGEIESKEYKKGGKIDRTKSTKKSRVNRTKKAIAQDKNIKALHAGKRESENGIYYEYRENRSDKNRTVKLEDGGEIWGRELINHGGEELPKPKFQVNDMVYSWQNPNEKARVSHIRFEKWLNDGKKHENDQWKYKVSLKDKDGYSHSSKWMSEGSLSDNKKEEYAKGGDLKNYTSADLPKDGSEIKIHMPKMGKFPAEDIVLKYNQDNFAFDAYRNGELSGTRITEKQVLDNLNNGSYEFKNDSNFKYKKGDVVYVYQYHSDPRNSSTDSIRNDKEEIEKYLGIDKKYIVGKKPSQQKWSKVEILEPWSEEKGWESYKVKQLDGYRKEGEFIANQSQMSKTNTGTIAIGYMQEGGEVEAEEYAKGGSIKEVDFENSNVIFYGFSHDKNGNSVVKVGFPNQTAFSLQINDPSWFRFTKGKYTKNISELEPSDVVKIEEEIVEYIRNFGSKKQKESLKVYSKFKGGVRDAKEINALLQDAIRKTKDLSAKEIADMWNANINTEISKSWTEEEVAGNISHFRSYLKDLLFEKELTEAEYSEYFEKGGKIGFEGLAKKVAREYEGDKVKPEYQAEYGKTYDKEEALEVGQKVASKVYRGQEGMMEKGGEIKTELTLSEIESKLGKTFGFWSVPYEVTVDGTTYRKEYMGKNYKKI